MYICVKKVIEKKVGSQKKNQTFFSRRVVEFFSFKIRYL